jgi:hypothetical protein
MNHTAVLLDHASRHASFASRMDTLVRHGYCLVSRTFMRSCEALSRVRPPTRVGMNEAPVHIVAGASLVPERELTAVTQAFQRRTVSSAAWGACSCVQAGDRWIGKGSLTGLSQIVVDRRRNEIADPPIRVGAILFDQRQRVGEKIDRRAHQARPGLWPLPAGAPRTFLDRGCFQNRMQRRHFFFTARNRRDG